MFLLQTDKLSRVADMSWRLSTELLTAEGSTSEEGIFVTWIEIILSLTPSTDRTVFYQKMKWFQHAQKLKKEGSTQEAQRKYLKTTWTTYRQTFLHHHQQHQRHHFVVVHHQVFLLHLQSLFLDFPKPCTLITANYELRYEKLCQQQMLALAESRCCAVIAIMDGYTVWGLWAEIVCYPN